jgi:molybdopterin-binding protein
VLAVLEPTQWFVPVDPDSAVVLPVRDVAGEGFTSVVVTAPTGDPTVARSRTGRSTARFRTVEGLPGAMALSARNRLSGTVVSIDTSGPMAEVVIDVDGTEVTSTITSKSVERLGLEEGSSATAVIKASDVMVESE